MTFGSEPLVFRGDAGAVSSLAFSPDGQTLAVGSVDACRQVLEHACPSARSPRSRHMDSIVSSLAFSPDGRTLATISVDETMRLWRAPGFAELDR